jgi:hypothetical protein
VGDHSKDDSTQSGDKRFGAAVMVPVPAVLLALGVLSSPAVGAPAAQSATSHLAGASTPTLAAATGSSHEKEQISTNCSGTNCDPAPLPMLDPLALGGLAAMVAWFGMRAKRD